MTKFIDALYPEDYVKVRNLEINNQNTVRLSFKATDSEDEQHIVLDKSTAIKLAKALMTEINKTQNEATGN